MRGVTAAAAAWRPARGRKSIWELALHVAYWKYAVRRRLDRTVKGHSIAGPRFARGPANWPEVPRGASEEAWRADMALLREEHERLIAAIERVPVKDYWIVAPESRRWTMGDLIVGIAMHDAYHAGQIQMLKRLYRSPWRGRM